MIKEIEKEDLDIREVTLLSVEEAELAKQNVPDILRNNAPWWLRSPGINDILAALVRDDGYILLDGYYMIDFHGVRPALRISNLESNNLQVGNTIQVADHYWTIVTKDLALCDEIIETQQFNRSYSQGNDYDSSHIKEFVNRWGKDMRLTNFDKTFLPTTKDGYEYSD